MYRSVSLASLPYVCIALFLNLVVSVDRSTGSYQLPVHVTAVSGALIVTSLSVPSRLIGQLFNPEGALVANLDNNPVRPLEKVKA